MEVTARPSSNGRSPGAAMIASTRAPSRACRTIPFSSSAHSPRSASAARATSTAALASSPAQETTSCRAAAASATASDKAALRRHRAGATCRSASGTPVVAAPWPAPPPGRARRPARRWPCRRGSPHPVDLVPARLRLVEPVPDDVEAAVEQIDPLALHPQPGAAVHEPPPRPRLDHGALETERPHVLGSDRIAVVEPEVPVAVRMDKTAPARAAARHGHDPGDLDQPARQARAPVPFNRSRAIPTFSRRPAVRRSLLVPRVPLERPAWRRCVRRGRPRPMPRQRPGLPLPAC
jgi:hypothetical protein